MEAHKKYTKSILPELISVYKINSIYLDVHAFIPSYNKLLLSMYYVWGTVLSFKVVNVSKTYFLPEIHCFNVLT